MFGARVEDQGYRTHLYDAETPVSADVVEGHLILSTREEPCLAAYAPGTWRRFWRVDLREPKPEAEAA